MLSKLAEHIKGHDLLQNQICQALEKQRLAHALLFSGPSGIGKREMAWALAQNLLCEKKACGKCSTCLRVLKKQHENILCVTHETLEIRLQDVKAIPSFLSLQTLAPAKVILIDSAEKMNLQASNFLLKVIEEPPPKSFFILISSSPFQIPVTIRSRVQHLRFRALSEEVLARLSPPELPSWMIRACRGRLDLLEELQSQTELRDLAFDLWSEIFSRSFSALTIDFAGKIKDRQEALSLCHFWQEILRDARFLKLAHFDQLIHRDKKKEIERLSALPPELLDFWIKKILKMEADLKAHANYVLCFENYVISMKKDLESFNSGK